METETALEIQPLQKETETLQTMTKSELQLAKLVAKHPLSLHQQFQVNEPGMRPKTNPIIKVEVHTTRENPMTIANVIHWSPKWNNLIQVNIGLPTNLAQIPILSWRITNSCLYLSNRHK